MMTLQDWQQNKDLVQWTANVFNSPNGKLFWEMLVTGHPMRTHLPPVASDSVKSTALGEIYGYNLALNNIEAAQQMVAPPAQLVETYGAKPV